MKNLVNAFLNEESGQGLVEYGLILALIAIVVIAILRIVGNKLNSTFNSIQSALPETVCGFYIFIQLHVP